MQIARPTYHKKYEKGKFTNQDTDKKFYTIDLVKLQSSNYSKPNILVTAILPLNANEIKLFRIYPTLTVKEIQLNKKITNEKVKKNTK